MTGPRPKAAQLADHLLRHHHGPGSLATICRAALQTPCSVGLALAADAALARRISLCGDGPLADAGETLQINLGEGPCVQALQQRATVLADDLADPGVVRLFPLFAHQARARGIRAVLALPAPPRSRAPERGGLVLCLYRDRPGPLPLADRHTAADHLGAALLLLQAACTAEGRPPPVRLPEPQALLHQAVGVICYHHAVSVDQALDLLRSHAFSHGMDLGDLARAVVRDDLRLPGETGTEPTQP
ncbi:ANTAR domain-containing protein [Streptomyces poonensis]|uniref:GAF domain-containing protein n=1 Tax=Streptomyces poonensis TaxID=68255 RepID=A0A918UMD1_9ACTN|nr:ANTAR domain-containing protein [Streptomyces poonensis]GGZ20976.1 GAF domain-containing protein [Streptomyces poonensis]